MDIGVFPGAILDPLVASLRHPTLKVNHELVGRAGYPSGLMKDRIQLNVWEASLIGQCSGESRLARTGASNDYNPFHVRKARSWPVRKP